MDYKHRLQIKELLLHEAQQVTSHGWKKIILLSGLVLIASGLFFLHSSKPKDIPPQNVMTFPPTPLATAPATTAPTMTTAIGPQWKTITVANRDTLSRIFSRLKFDKKLLQTLLALKYAGKYLRHLQPKQTLEILLDDDHQLLKLKYPISLTDTLEISRANKGFQERILHIIPETRLAYSEGIIRKGARIQGLDKKMKSQLTSIFKDKINFSRKLRPGDRFRLLVEQRYVHNQKLAVGDIVAAEAIVGKNIYRAVRYVDPHGHISYFTPEGQSLHKGFLRFPVSFTRISSRFSLSRLNPITHLFRPHAATDFAAPTGTPIKATADGQISFAGTKHGYGRTIMLRHFGGYSTLYAHMRNFSSSVRPGSHVKQGQVIGYVGSTGNSTGHHLHYEFYYKTKKLNPLTVPLPEGTPLVGLDRLRFMPKARQLITQLETKKHE